MEAIRYNSSIVLMDPIDIVRASFIVQNTLSPLDLSLAEHTRNLKYLCTEEMVRKEHSLDWNLLYKYGLDLPNSSMVHLRSHCEQSRIKHFLNLSEYVLKEIKVEPFAYNRYIGDYLRWNITRRVNRVEALRRHLTVIKSFFDDFIPFSPNEENLHFFFILCLGILRNCQHDSTTIMEFIRNCKRGFSELVSSCDDSNVLEHILISLNHFKYTPYINEIDIDPINAVAIFESIHNIVPLLKFGWKPKYNKRILLEYIHCVNATFSCGFTDCGISYEPKIALIFHGTSVDPLTKYPWIVKLEVTEDDENSVCGGAIITVRHILTAAHCVVRTNEGMKECFNAQFIPKSCIINAENITVIPALPQNFQNSSEKIHYQVQTVIPHSQYQQQLDINSKMRNDIALLVLQKEMTCDEFRAPICVNTMEFQNSEKNIIVAGAGYFSRSKSKLGDFKEGVVHQIPASLCVEELNEKEIREMDEVFCSEGKSTGQEQCAGDSGSSLFTKIDGVFYTIAITSAGETDNCTDQDKSYDTKVSHYYKWIKKHVKKLPKPPLKFGTTEKNKVKKIL